MARAYSQDLRERVLNATAEGWSVRGAAARLGVGAKTAIEWVRRARETGERTARRQGQPRGSKLDAHAAFLLGLIAKTDDITLVEVQGRQRDEQGISAGTTTLWRFFDARGLTFKTYGPPRLQGVCEFGICSVCIKVVRAWSADPKVGEWGGA